MEEGTEESKDTSSEEAASPTPDSSTSAAEPDKSDKSEEGEEEEEEKGASAADKETVDFKIIYNKKKFDVTFPLDDTVTSLRKHVETLTGYIAYSYIYIFFPKYRIIS